MYIADHSASCYTVTYTCRHAAEGAGLYIPFYPTISRFSKNISKKFAGLKNCRTFAIPKQSGGGEMVDTLL